MAVTDTADTASESAPVCGCGLPMSRNPHLDAGKPTMAGAAVGYAWECIPCLVKTRNRVGASWRAVEAQNERLRTAINEVGTTCRLFAEGCGAHGWEREHWCGGCVLADAVTTGGSNGTS